MRRHLAPLLLCTGCLISAFAEAATKVPTGFVHEPVALGFAEPNSMAFLPDWRILVTEQRSGKVRMVVGASISVTNVLSATPDLNAAAYERGLQGIAVDPAWPQRPYVYLYYTRTGGYCRVVRYSATGSLNDPSGIYVGLFNPVILIDDIPDAIITHNGGCLRFGPDGHLYVSLGDDDTPCAARDSSSLRGSILRLRVHTLGENVQTPVPRALITPLDNPLSTPDTNARLVWAWGLRNPWRFHIDPMTGKLYAAEVGLLTYEEINEIVPGDFMGWPWREGPQVMVRGSCPEPGGQGTFPYKAGMVNLLRNPSDQVSISTAGIYRPLLGASYNWAEQYHGDYFYGEYYSGELRRMKNVKGTWMPADSVPGQPSAGVWATGLKSAVDFGVGPDGSLYYLTQYDSTQAGMTGGIYRIRQSGEPPPLSVDPSLSSQIYFRVAPNPFRSTTDLSFRLPRGAHAKVDLFDLQGRRVRRLMDGNGVAGENRVTWDGADDQHRPVKPGIYLARLDMLGYTKTLRVVRVQ
jgi:glucose/arabinose dehydrogenase